MKSEAVLAIIPARGGSKGIPLKNLRLFGGRPLLAWTVEAALRSTRVGRVVVSTDHDEIAKTAHLLGAEVVRRPQGLSGDEAPSESALEHALDTLAAESGYQPDVVVFLQATSPARPRGAIDEALALMEREHADSLFSASPVHGFVWRESHSALRSLTYDHHARPRRQDIGRDWLENGSIYLFRPNVLRQHKNRLGGKVVVFPMHPLDSFQIDEEADLEQLEEVFRLRRVASAQPLDAELRAIRLLALDFDGVMTDDRVLVNQDGQEAVWCSRGDGMGLERLRHSGVEAVVLSKETNPVVAARCRKLGIGCSQGIEEKLSALQELAALRNLRPEQIAYVGNDVNDVRPLGWVGLPIAVADAREEAKRVARWTTEAPGGRGAVREICERILAARDRLA